MSNLTVYSEKIFEKIKHINEYGEEFWYARELQKVLEYRQWRRFEEVIEKAKTACQGSGNNILEHFADVGKSIPMPKGGARIVNDIMLSRYALCGVTLKAEKTETVFLLYFFIKSAEGGLKMDGYSYLTFDQRREIEALYGEGIRTVEIAAKIGRSVAAIYEELKRGYTGELDENKRPVYSADLAQQTAQENIRRRGNRRAANQ